jgi:hypothetical protein
MNNIDDYFLIMPGYSISVYKAVGYTDSIQSYDNSSGTRPLYVGSNNVNNASSCRLFYGTATISDGSVNYNQEITSNNSTSATFSWNFAPTITTIS